MKYNIHIPQKEAILISEDIDILDMAIFDFIQYFSQTNSCRKLYNGDIVYFWIAYDLVIDEMPLLKIKTKDAIYRRIQKLVSVDLLSPHPDNQKMGKTYFRFGDAFSGLYSDRGTDEKPKGVRMKSRRGTDEKPKGGTDEKSDKEEHHIEDNHKKTIYTIFSFWNDQKIIEHKESPTIDYQIEKALKKYSEEDIKTAITNYSKILKSKRTWWDYKWTLSGFLSRDKALPVFLYKTEKDYLSNTSGQFVDKATEIQKSQDAEKRALDERKREETYREQAENRNTALLQWYKEQEQEKRTEILEEVESDYMIKNFSHPTPLDGLQETERKKLSFVNIRRVVLLKVIAKHKK